MPLSINSTLLQLQSDPRAKEILAKHLPGVWEHPMIKLAMGMPLKVIAGLPQAKQAGVKPEMLTTIGEELSKL